MNGGEKLIFLEIYRVVLMFLAICIIQERPDQNCHLALSLKDLEAVNKQ